MKRIRKQKKTEIPKLMLEEIVGFTTENANGLASGVSNSKCVYIAGCVAVVYDVDSSTQSHLVVSNRLPKPLSCVAVSCDGRFIAAGESGPHPAVVIWEAASLVMIYELKSHQHGVACIAFSPDGKHLASVGYPHDGYICLWDFHSQTLITKCKGCTPSSAIASISFSSDGRFFITAGKKHLKFWKLGLSTRSRMIGRTASGAIGKQANLGHYKGCSFIAIASPMWSESSLLDHIQTGEALHVYALTDAGVLCHLNSEMTIANSVELQVEKGFGLSVSRKLVACACNNGQVKLFSANTLAYAGSLYYPETRHSIESVTDCHVMIGKNGHEQLQSLPNAIACQFSTLQKLVVIYDDRSLFIWDVQDVDKASRCSVLVSHSACIWDIKNFSCEHMHDPSKACVAKGCSGGVSFATCSADGSIRLWDLELQSSSLPLPTEDKSMSTFSAGSTHLERTGVFERDSLVSGFASTGYRSMAVSSDGMYLGAGDFLGNLHIFNLHTTDYMCIQVSSDGCIFVWKVPGLLSLRMLRKIKENACPLSPAKFAAPATSGQIKLHVVNHHQPEGISMTPKLFQVNQRVLCREMSSPATAFKFSISRLPKWAQAKVTNLHSLMTDPNSSSSKTGKTGSTDTQRPACETVHVYEEALHNLDAAAEKAMQLFSKLANQHARIEKSREHENQLLAKAAEMLVPIANKIHATAKLAQSANTGSNGNAKMDISTNEI